LNTSIGQGEVLSTPLQLAQLYCGLANNGVVYRPHILKKINSPDGAEQIPDPVVSFRLPFSAETIEILKEGMRLVIEGEHGTAKSQRRKWYAFGGKTGTAQNPHGDNHSWFGAIAPLDNPEIVVVAIVENAGHGSEIAAPVVAGVLDFFMSKKTGRLQLTNADTTRADSTEVN
jgi:penicillin-binding protein 2